MGPRGLMIVRRMTHDERETIAMGEAVGRVARAGDVIAIEGELGAGKTRFVRGLVMGMGLDPAAVSSPTFVMVHEYTRAAIGSGGRGGAGEEERAGSSGGRLTTMLVHVDAWRLDGAESVSSLGMDGLRDASAVVAIEWADRLGGLVPSDALRVRIEHADEGRRRITLDGGASWSARLRELE